MSPLFIVSEYFTWQYSYGIAELLRAWMNIHWFLYYFFSFPMLLRTLFQPLFRLKEEYGLHFSLQQIIEAITVNIIMRITGFITRVILLCLGFIIECLFFVIGLTGLIIYLTSPLGVPLFLFASLL